MYFNLSNKAKSLLKKRKRRPDIEKAPAIEPPTYETPMPLHFPRHNDALKERSSDLGKEPEKFRVSFAKAKQTESYESLRRIFASLYVMQTKMRKYKWNKSSSWKPNDKNKLVDFLNTEKAAIDQDIDDLAVQIAALGFTVPGSLDELAKLSNVVQIDDIPQESTIYMRLCSDARVIMDMMQSAIELTWSSGDFDTGNLLQRLMKRRRESLATYRKRLENAEKIERALMNASSKHNMLPVS